MEHPLIGPARPTSVQPIGANKNKAQGHVDIVLFLGPDVGGIEQRFIKQACKGAGLSVTVVGDDEGNITQANIDRLHRSGALGPNTHVIVTGHGAIEPNKKSSSASHAMAGWETIELIEALRSHPDEAQSPLEHPPWPGMIHLLACEAGHLKTTFTPEHPLWSKGPCLVHANTKPNIFGMVAPHILQVIRLLADRKKRGLPNPEPALVQAEVAIVSEESLLRLGGDLREAALWRAPKNRDEAVSAHTRAEALRLELEQKLPSCDKKGDDGHRVGGAVDAKLRNSTFVRTHRGNAAALASFLDADKGLLHERDATGSTLLSTACAGGHLEIVRDLLDRGSDVHARDDDGSTLLHDVCSSGSSEIAQLLLQRGHELNQKDAEGHTPLHLACLKGRFALAQTLLQAGADPHIGDEDGCTALHLVCQGSDASLVALLAEHQADLDAENKDGSTPLSLACAYGRVDCAIALVSKGVDVNRKDKARGYTLAHYACGKNQYDALRYLYSENARLDVRSIDGRTPLSLAAERGHDAIVNYLLEREARVDAADIDGSTPLMYACVSGKTACVERLIQGGASLEARDADGLTPLMQACKQGELSVVACLLKAGANPNNGHPEAGSPLDLAREQPEIEDLLRRAIANTQATAPASRGGDL